MATMEDSIYTYLAANTSISAYVGTDIYFAARPDGLETDYICYDLIDPSNEPYCFGTTNTAQPEFQFSVFSKNCTNCLAIGNLLATALNRYAGEVGTGGNNVIFSTAAGPMVSRDRIDPQWYMGIVTWTPEYER